MKVAILISGHLRNSLFDNIKKNILDVLAQHFEIDTFISTWNEQGHRIGGCLDTKTELNFQNIYNNIKFYNPKNIEIEEHNTDFFFKEFYTDKYKNFKECSSETSTHASSMWYKLYKCYCLMKSYSETYNVKYDLILRLRTDIIYDNPLNINDVLQCINNDYVYMPEWHNKYESVTLKMMDHIFFGNVKVMSNICSLFNNIKIYLTKDIPPS